MVCRRRAWVHVAVLVGACAGCAPAKLENTVDTLRQNHATLAERAAELTQRFATVEQSQAALAARAAAAEDKLARLQGIAADIEAVKAYFKQVEDSIRSLRADTVILLDEQRARVDEGREEYLRILRGQEQLLRGILPQLGEAIQKLQQKLPESEGRLAEAPAFPELHGSAPPGGPECQ